MSGFVIQAGGAIAGDGLLIPGDKSISHRSVMISAIARGKSRITGLLRGTDVVATVNAFRNMGVQCEEEADGGLRISGVGAMGLEAPGQALDLGNSGTAMRLLAGLLCGQRFSSILVGDESLNQRPMRRITEPLGLMGADIVASDDGTPPISIHPVKRLHGLVYDMPVASAQVKSAILLASLYAEEPVWVRETAVTRDHTERMLQGFGLSVETGDAGCRVLGGELRATDIEVPADFSSSAFFLVAALISKPGSELRLKRVGVNPTRTGALEILRRMGASIIVENETDSGGEPVADLVVRASDLHGIDIPTRLVPLAIDEFPILCIAAACAEGVTRIRGAEELRYKESDRIAAMAAGLKQLGVNVDTAEDGMTIRGVESLAGGKVDSYGDHRIAMSFAMSAVRASGTIEVLNCDNVSTSFPGFPELARAGGLGIEHVR